VGSEGVYFMSGPGKIVLSYLSDLTPFSFQSLNLL
jgi:hypothetical protein